MTFLPDQGGSSYPEGRSTIHEPGRRELPTQPYVRPLSWLDTNLSHQELEKRRPSTSFFWWRPLMEVETSNVKNFLVVSMKFLLVSYLQLLSNLQHEWYCFCCRCVIQSPCCHVSINDLIFLSLWNFTLFAFSALMLLVGQQEGQAPGL